MSDYTDEDVRAGLMAAADRPECEHELSLRGSGVLVQCDLCHVRAVLDAVAPAIVARERSRADAYEAALTEERAMAHQTIRALQAEVASAKAEALREAASDIDTSDPEGDEWSTSDLRARADEIEARS